MPNILNDYVKTGYDAMCVPCQDNSVYFDDASLLVDMVDIRKLNKAIKDQIHKVAETAQSDDFTVDDMLKEIDQLRNMTRVLATFDRLAKK